MSIPVKPLDWLRAAVDDDRLTTTERAAVAGIARRAPGRSQPGRFSGQVTGWDFYLSRNELAGLMGASVRTAERSLARLEELGLLEEVVRGGRRGIQNVATVWRLAIPNPSRVATWEPSQPATGDDMGTGPNSSETTFPTRQRHRSHVATGDDPREHRLQESTVPQESTADAHLLTQVIVSENHSNSEHRTRPTEDQNVTTDRAPAVVWGQVANTSEAWVS